MALSSARSRVKARQNAFTLVELLVVIGIIAVLISILLPVMGRARESARTVKCLANLRSIGQAIFGYRAENRDSLPWGFAWNRMNAAGANAQSPAYLYSWATLINKYVQKDNSGAMYPFLSSSTENKAVAARFSEFFQCPSVDTGTFSQSVHYMANSVAMPSYPHEKGGNPAGGTTFPDYSPLPTTWKGRPYNQAVKPATGSDLYPDNALVWDTPVLIKTTTSTDFGWRVSFVDGGQLMSADNPWLRYRSKDHDFYKGAPGLQQGEGVFIGNPTDFPEGFNMDVGDLGAVWNYQWGTTRFRHNRDTVCNAVFADGSARSMKMDPRKMTPGTNLGSWPHGGAMNEFLRDYIMIKWPNGEWEGPPEDSTSGDWNGR